MLQPNVRFFFGPIFVDFVAVSKLGGNWLAISLSERRSLAL